MGAVNGCGAEAVAAAPTASLAVEPKRWIFALRQRHFYAKHREMELPEPYNSTPIHLWRKLMRATPHSYATAGVRAWLKSRHKIRLRPDASTYASLSPSTRLTPAEIEDLQHDKRESIEVLRRYYRTLDAASARESDSSPIP